MHQDQIQDFLKKFSSGVYTEEKHQQFIDWLRTAPIEEVEKIVEEYKTIAEFKQSNSLNPELVSQIESALNQYELGKEMKFASGKVMSLRTFRKIAVAASIILAIALGSYFLFFNKTEKQNGTAKTNPPVPHDVYAPTIARATLRLNDGTIVYLDSANNGSLALQGNINVVKLADGQVTYQSAVDSSQLPVQYNTLANPRGSIIQSLTLSDGTKVWLNSESSIKYPVAFIGSERKVEITGEAYFEVTKDASKKFIVDANGAITEVLGTHFNVNSYADEGNVKVTLLEGSVKVSKGTLSALIKPNQQALLSEKINVSNSVDVEEVVSWKNGRFQFNKASLQEVMRQISRWYNVDVSYQGEIAPQQFGGKMQRDLTLSEVLEGLQKSEVHFKIEGRKIIVTK